MRTLVVHSDAKTRRALAQLLDQDGHEVVEASRAARALEVLHELSVQVVLVEIGQLRDGDLDLLREIREMDPDVPVVVTTGRETLELAEETLRRGAYDCLVEPLEHMQRVSATVRRAGEVLRLVRDNRGLTDRLRRQADEVQALKARVRVMVDRDGLTGLFNRRYFRNALEREIARARRHEREFSLVFLDIDRFMEFNVHHGHLAGDQFLVDLAAILEQRCRATTVASRYGEEEFALLVPETSSAGALRFADHLRRIVSDHRFSGGDARPAVRVTMSAGVVTYPGDGTDTDTLVARAEQTVREAKENGRDTVCCWSEVEARTGPAWAGSTT